MAEPVVDDSFSHQELVDLQQGAYVSSENPSAGHKGEVSFGVASVGLGNKIPVGFVELRGFESLSGEELVEVLNFLFVDIFVVKPVCGAGRQFPLALDLVVDLLFLLAAVGFWFEGFLMVVVDIFRKCIFFGYDWRDFG